MQLKAGFRLLGSLLIFGRAANATFGWPGPRIPGPPSGGVVFAETSLIGWDYKLRRGNWWISVSSKWGHSNNTSPLGEGSGITWTFLIFKLRFEYFGEKVMLVWRVGCFLSNSFHISNILSFTKTVNFEKQNVTGGRGSEKSVTYYLNGP